MNSIYEQLNKINDKESLSEKYIVKNTEELKKLKEGLTIHEYEPEFAGYTPKIYLPTDKQGKCELVIYASLADFDDPNGDWDVNVEMNDSRGYPAFEIDETNGLADEIDNLGHIYLTSYSFEEAEKVCANIRQYFIEVDSEDFYNTFVNVLHCDRAGVEKLWNNPANKFEESLIESEELKNSEKLKQALANWPDTSKTIDAAARRADAEAAKEFLRKREAAHKEAWNLIHDLRVKYKYSLREIEDIIAYELKHTVSNVEVN